ncbi:MAG: response regulator transcription factor, partial [Angelakisella sp.]
MIRVLIAEDFDLLREDLTETLAAQPDITVVGSASSGAAIVELAKTTPCDIVLMDIEMERLNAGILAAEEIRDFAPNIKVIFLTAHETKQMILTAMGTGAVDYVVKGCPDEELLQH